MADTRICGQGLPAGGAKGGNCDECSCHCQDAQDNVCANGWMSGRGLKAFPAGCRAQLISSWPTTMGKQQTFAILIKLVSEK